jgi:formamidopyrimidine-DNA glycosylase
MPELPEVQTTVNGLNRTVKGRKIVTVWTDYKSAHKMHAESIKNPKYFQKFKKKVSGQKILGAKRRAKNILISLANGETILVHMKMTGHFVYDAEKDYPYIHLVFTLDNGKRLIFSDLRKFAKVALLNDSHLANLGPEPLDKNFNYKVFRERLLKRPNGKIKQVLLDQSLVAGIGNIYSDEILWRASVHPLSKVEKIPETNFKAMFKATRETLKKGIDFGGDSTSDYRNIEGKPGRFQATHRAYQRTKEKCSKPGCRGRIERLVIGARSAHFCSVHQTLYS